MVLDAGMRKSIKENRNRMKKIALTACIIFAVLTFIGIGYALWKGKNAGYAVIPMAIFVICLAFYRSKDKK